MLGPAGSRRIYEILQIPGGRGEEKILRGEGVVFTRRDVGHFPYPRYISKSPIAISPQTAWRGYAAAEGRKTFTAKTPRAQS
jgi:hypothetical protein